MNITTVEQRAYQREIFERAIKENVICFIPTGGGKTRIAIALILHTLKLKQKAEKLSLERKIPLPPRKWIAFLVPTTSLAQQQFDKLMVNIFFSLSLSRCASYRLAAHIDNFAGQSERIQIDWRIWGGRVEFQTFRSIIRPFRYYNYDPRDFSCDFIAWL